MALNKTMFDYSSVKLLVPFNNSGTLSVTTLAFYCVPQNPNPPF
jgi:hypothetical protein